MLNETLSVIFQHRFIILLGLLWIAKLKTKSNNVEQKQFWSIFLRAFTILQIWSPVLDKNLDYHHSVWKISFEFSRQNLSSNESFFYQILFSRQNQKKKFRFFFQVGIFSGDFFLNETFFKHCDHD